MTSEQERALAAACRLGDFKAAVELALSMGLKTESNGERLTIRDPAEPEAEWIFSGNGDGHRVTKWLVKPLGSKVESGDEENPWTGGTWTIRPIE